MIDESGSKGWSEYDQIDGSYILHADFRDDGTRFISENEVNSSMWWIDGTKAYMIYSPVLTAKSYTDVVFTSSEDYEEDGDEGGGYCETETYSRFSNDKASWTPWLRTGRSKSHLYKYAQVGYFYGAINDRGDYQSMWFSFKISSVSFNIT